MKKMCYALAFVALPCIVQAQNGIKASQQSISFKPPFWSLKGNSGTNPAINFLGTKDAQPLVFRVNNKISGFIEYDSLKGNTSLGYRSLQLNTSIYNTAMGYQALSFNTNGQYNTATGAFALYSNQTGLGNVANGAFALNQNTFGSFNTAIGQDAMRSTTFGSNNVAVGNQVLTQNLTGSNNVAMGSLALYFNKASDNTALGSNALYDNTDGTGNTATGEYSLYINTTGNSNTAVGNASLFLSSTGNNNTAVGNSAMSFNFTGSNNTAIGYNANVTSGNLSNATAIGYAAAVDSSNKVRLGNNFVNSIGGEVNFTNYAADNIKKDIEENVPGLKFINALRPVTYNLNLVGQAFKATGNIPSNNSKVSSFLKTLNSITTETSKQIGEIRFTGLLASEVATAANALSYDFSGIDKNGTATGIRYAEFVMPLIKAVQELSKKNDEKNEKINDLQKQIDDLKAMITGNQSTARNTQQAVAAGAMLQQNTPNPFANSTTIQYTLPATYSSAIIKVTNAKGEVVKQIKLTGSGNGNIQLDASSLASGTYQYSLYINEKLIGSRKMMLIK